MGNRPRVLVFVKDFPQISQTYIKNEIEALEPDHEILVVARREPDIRYRTDRECRRADDPKALLEIVREFRPDVMHGHWLHSVHPLDHVARKTGVPYTIRSHSFDVLAPGEPVSWRRRFSARLRGRPDPGLPLPVSAARLVRGPRCLGVLAFPFARPVLEAAGMPDDKIIDCRPVVAFSRFFDRSPNGEGVMNVGACLPKKRMEDFVDLAAKVPERTFRIYALGYEAYSIHRYAAERRSPVEFVPPVEPDDMPGEYKRHRWLVYTACPVVNTVGWPVAVAEAQASGTGVLMAGIRPDLADYVGAGGRLFRTIDEIVETVRGPVPEEMREAGFAEARRSDIAVHRGVLTSLWASALSARHKTAPPGR